MERERGSMTSRRRAACRGYCLGVSLLLAGASPGKAVVGLGARFGDVILENIQPGRAYDLRELAHVPFVVENHGDDPAEVEVRFRRPDKAKLSKDFEAIPDPGWFKAVPAKIVIGPHSQGYFDLLLTVPDEPGLKGKNFQVSAVAAMVGTGVFNVGIENRIRFSIGPGPESLQAEKKKKAMQQLDFDVTPSELYVNAVSVGQTYDVRKEARKSIRVANYSSDKLSVLMTVEKWDISYPLPEGYEPIPDASWIGLEKSTVTVTGDEIGQANLIVKVPDEAKWKGRRFAAMVRTGLTTGFWLDAPVRVYLETKP